MADRKINAATTEVPEMPEVLEKVLLYALNEGRQKMEAGDEVVPFTALVVKDDVFIETHPADSSTECFELAQHTVEGARGANAYAFCYDGYIETDDGTRDVLIAEGGVPGAEAGHAIGLLYTIGEGATAGAGEDAEGTGTAGAGEDAEGTGTAGAGEDVAAAAAGEDAAEDGAATSPTAEGATTTTTYNFDENPAYIGEAPNFMSKLKAAAQYSDKDLDERYKDGTFTEVSQEKPDISSG